jgi:hypothetical protein
MFLKISRFDEKEPENGMAAIGAVRFTFYAGAVSLLHLLEGRLGSVCHSFVALKEIARLFHDCR